MVWKWYEERKRLGPHLPLHYTWCLACEFLRPRLEALSEIQDEKEDRVNTAEIQDTDHRALQFIQYNEFLKSREIKTLVLQSYPNNVL